MVDEHYYKPPQWFWDNLSRYDSYNRDQAKVYVGEYAAHDDRRRTTLRSALAEAAYLTALERNADVVTFASYAPLLAKRGHTDWNPNLIYFSNTRVVPTINYYVQQLFSLNSGDRYLPTTVKASASAPQLAMSAVRDGETGDCILKLVNGTGTKRPLQITLLDIGRVPANAIKTVLYDNDPMTANGFAHPSRVVPEISPINVGPEFSYEAAAHSLTVIRFGRGDTP
jgi:alpha-L-arabinofuranosidase